MLRPTPRNAMNASESSVAVASCSRMIAPLAHGAVGDRVQHEDHEQDQRDVRDVAALDLVVDRGEHAHDAARHHELHAARPRSGRLVARRRARRPSGRATIRSVVFDRDGADASSAFSHHWSTSGACQSASALGQVKTSPCSTDSRSCSRSRASAASRNSPSHSGSAVARRRSAPRPRRTAPSVACSCTLQRVVRAPGSSGPSM